MTKTKTKPSLRIDKKVKTTILNYGLIKQFNMKNYDKLHAKTLLIDGRTLIIGSFNLDNHGFSTNMEIGLITQNTTTITQYIYFIDSLMN